MKLCTCLKLWEGGGETVGGLHALIVLHISFLEHIKWAGTNFTYCPLSGFLESGRLSRGKATHNDNHYMYGTPQLQLQNLLRELTKSKFMMLALVRSQNITTT
jgi:hypothetical protein